MRRLLQGIHHFQNTVFEKNREFFERLQKGQQPETLFITCSDSRVNPSLFTQTKPGELFIVRNAGAVVPPWAEDMVYGESAAVEYAVTVLKVKDIIVCGHSHCGALNALLNPNTAQNLPAMRRWLELCKETKSILDTAYADLPDDERYNVAIQENVLVQLEHLKTHPCVKQAMDEKLLRLHGWVYKFETGQVFNYDLEQGQFVPLLGEGDVKKFRMKEE